MKIQLLIIFTFLNISSLMMIQGAEEEPKRGTVQFYEKLYKTKINGVKSIGEYSDPDQFFTAIARQVGIPKLAFEAVEKKFGWKASEDVFLNAVVKGSSVQDDWGVMVFRFNKKSIEQMQKDRAAGKSIPREEMKKKMGMEMKFVTIDYEGKISFPEEKKKKPIGDKDKAGYL